VNRNLTGSLSALTGTGGEYTQNSEQDDEHVRHVPRHGLLLCPFLLPLETLLITFDDPSFSHEGLPVDFGDVEDAACTVDFGDVEDAAILVDCGDVEDLPHEDDKGSETSIPGLLLQ